MYCMKELYVKLVSYQELYHDARSAKYKILTDVSGQPIVPIFKAQEFLL